MSVNLLQMAGNLFDSGMIKQVSGLLGESESSTQKAVSGMLPALLGGIVNQASDAKGASGLLGMMDKFNLDGGMLSNVAGMLGGDEGRTSLMGMGGSLLSGIFGDKVGGIVDSISGFAGIKKDSSSSLLSMGLPMIMSLLGKQRKEKGLDAAGLMGLLGDQKSFLKGANMPAGLGSLLGLGGLVGGAGDAIKGAAGAASGAASAAAGRATGAASDVAEAGKSGIAKLLPWIIGLLALAAVAYFLMGRGGDVKDVMKDAQESVSEGVEGTMDAARNAGDAIADGAENVGDAISDGANAAMDKISSISLPGGEEIQAKAGSFTSKLVGFLGGNKDGDGSFVFDGVNFNVGSNELTAASQSQLNNLVKVLNAYGEQQVMIVGHTDNTGDEAKNVALSQRRAESVKVYLVQKGVAEARISTGGKGSAEPIGDNATDAGRLQNRRIELRLN